MSWTHQVWQVFRKDVMRQRWLLLLFVLCAVGSVASVLRDSTTMALNSVLGEHSRPLAELLWLLLPAFAALLCATVILEDVPTAPRAHWATLPIDRSAVFGAKLCFVLGVVPLIVFGALAVLHLAFSVRLMELPVLLATGVRTLVTLTVIALPLAAIVRELREFFLAAVALATVFAMAIDGASFEISAVAPLTQAFIAVLLTSCSVFITWQLYKRRRRSWVMYAAVGVLSVLHGACIVIPVAPYQKTLSASLPDARLTSTWQRTTNATARARSFAWQLHLAGLPPDRRATLRVIRAGFMGPETCRRALSKSHIETTLQYPVLPLGRELHWLGNPPQFTRSVDTAFTNTWTLHTGENECTPSLNAVLEMSTPRLLGSIPLSTGATLTSGGYRLTVHSTERSANGMLATLYASSSVAAPPLHRPGLSQLTYVLVHSQRSEAMMLNAAGQSLPAGRPIVRNLVGLFPRRLDDDSAGPHVDAWLRDAVLYVFTWDSRGVFAASPLLAEEQ